MQKRGTFFLFGFFLASLFLFILQPLYAEASLPQTASELVGYLQKQLSRGRVERITKFDSSRQAFVHFRPQVDSPLGPKDFNIEAGQAYQVTVSGTASKPKLPLYPQISLRSIVKPGWNFLVWSGGVVPLGKVIEPIFGKVKQISVLTKDTQTYIDFIPGFHNREEFQKFRITPGTYFFLYFNQAKIRPKPGPLPFLIYGKIHSKRPLPRNAEISLTNLRTGEAIVCKIDSEKRFVFNLTSLKKGYLNGDRFLLSSSVKTTQREKIISLDTLFHGRRVDFSVAMASTKSFDWHTFLIWAIIGVLLISIESIFIIIFFIRMRTDK